MRSFAFALGLVILTGCQEEVRPPETVGTPGAIGYARAYPHELERLTQAYDAGRTEALQRCGESVELIDAVKDPVDVELWEAILTAAEKNGASRFYVAQLRDNLAFGRIFHDSDDEITKRTAGTAQFTAEQKGCQASVEVGGATGGTLKRLVDKRLDDRLHDASEASELMRGRQDALGKNNVAPITKQADLIAYASYMMNLELPSLAYERDRMLTESGRVRETLKRAIANERDRQPRTDAEKKSSEESLRAYEESKALVEKLEKDLRGASEKVEGQLRETRESCHDILDAVRKSVRKRAKK